MIKNKIIYWLPRILSIAFVLFISLFALDVFGQYSGWELVVGLFMHLIPSFVLLAVVLISWKYELVGAVVFFAFAVFYVITAGLGRPWTWYAFISGPAVVVSILFLLSWLQKKKLKA
jgi:uncharacterized membrane protein